MRATRQRTPRVARHVAHRVGLDAVGSRGTGALADGPTRVPDEPANTDAAPAASATTTNTPITTAARARFLNTFISPFPR